MTSKPFPIPVRQTGPGSHVEEEELQYLDMPRDMRTYEMPSVPETEDVASLALARDTLARLLAMMNEWKPGAPNPTLDMRGVPPAAQQIANQMLGDGEVSIQVNGARTLRVQESVFTGVWRVVELDSAGQLLADWLEAAPLPAAVLAVWDPWPLPSRGETTSPRSGPMESSPKLSRKYRAPMSLVEQSSAANCSPAWQTPAAQVSSPLHSSPSSQSA